MCQSSEAPLQIASGDKSLDRLKRIDLVPLALIALTLLFFYRLAFTNLILARGDTFIYFYPYWYVRNTALMSGHLPLWSPDVFMGVPLLANSQVGTFYPLNWLVAPFSPPDGIRLSILFHVAFAALGVYALARRLGLSKLAAFAAGALFAFGGYIGSHVEQINQLQGLAWMPWLIYLLDRALKRPLPNVILLGAALALQFFSGHTQTVFISAVALAIYALCTRPVRGLITLACAGAVALVLAIPQLWPTLEMTGVSDRRGGLNINQATAFSFSPFVTGRGLLPSYDALIFGEYVSYPGVIGLGLAIVGALSTRACVRNSVSPPAPTKARRIAWPFAPRVTWLIMALVGLAFAYGLYDPLYWLIGTLPGFNLFRVPARWLVLFALGTALLAGVGVEWLRNKARLDDRVADSVGARHVVPLQTQFSWRSWRPGASNLRVYLAILIIFGGLAAASFLTLHQNDGTPVSLPTTLTLIGWASALIVLLIGVWRRLPLLLVGAAVIELWLAAQIMPYNALVPPDAYSAQRFTESQLIADDQGQTPPGRVLSISQDLFDPGDRAALEAQYAALGLSKDAVGLAFDAVKQKETIAANLPLEWGIQSVDGYDGGLLPTAYYTAFTSLFLPQGELRTVDGRLREILAKPECNGACIPDARWLSLMDVRSLITDKVYDLVQNGIFYDTALSGTYFSNPQQFVADTVDVLCNPCTIHSVTDYATSAVAYVQDGAPIAVGSFMRYRFRAPAPGVIGDIYVDADNPVQAVTLIDSRTGDYQELTPGPWTRALSSDIKLYQRRYTTPRLVLASRAQFVADSDAGTEDALKLMRDRAFAIDSQVVISGAGRPLTTPTAQDLSDMRITSYTDTQVSISVGAENPAYLVLTDAYYPGWKATVNGVDTPVERADVMFRAVQVPEGDSDVVFEYRPAWLPLALIIGGVGWLIALLGVVVLRKSRWFAAL
ncbi:MAG TPA: YfhO family protein [Phototrophicaceae bacterium]|nr:YfhO family protein [Phototrophicaceae bacterium]